MSLQELADAVGADLQIGVDSPAGPQSVVHGLSSLEEAGPEQVSFLAHPKYQALLETTSALAVFVRNGQPIPSRLTALRCPDPYVSFTHAVIRIHGYRRHPPAGVSRHSTIHPSSTLGEGAYVGPDVMVCEGCRLGAGCVLYPGVYVGPGCVLGAGCVLMPNVVLYDGCVLGDRVTIHANSVIGQDGLGYAPVGRNWLKIPQIGRVRIEDDVELGAGCTVDRATVGETVIGRGTKMSNLVAIGHGCKIGPDCMFVAQVGLAGSVKVGRHAIFAGQAGVAGHVNIGDDVQVGAKAGVAFDIPAGITVHGSPAAPTNEHKRELFSLAKLPAMMKEHKELVRKVRLLEAALERLSPAMPPGSEPLASATPAAPSPSGESS